MWEGDANCSYIQDDDKNMNGDLLTRPEKGKVENEKLTSPAGSPITSACVAPVREKTPRRGDILKQRNSFGVPPSGQWR
jgi:hypothetical protein